MINSERLSKRGPRTPKQKCGKSALGFFPTGSGCGAAWLARLLGVQEVPSSNLGSPTKFIKDLRTVVRLDAAFWGPIGVQMQDSRGMIAELFSGAVFACQIPWALSF